jgi:predicted dehydrogenase
MAEPIGVGIIGAGFMGRVHARAARSAGGRLVGVADSAAPLAETLARDLGFERVCERPEDLLAEPDVKIVHVCVPNYAHAQLAAEAIKAGKHVICEKPLATTVADAKTLESLADAGGVVTSIPFVYRFYPIVREIRERVRTGEGGRLHLLHGSYLQDWLAFESDSDWRVDDSLGGASRAFGDIGVHWADLVEFTSGHRITRLFARLLTVFPTRPGRDGPVEVRTEDACTVSFETDGGAIGSLVLSQVSLGRKNRLWFSLDGTEGSFVFDHEDPDILWKGGRASNQVVPRSADGLSDAAARYVTVPAGHPQGYQDCFNAFVADTYAAVGGAVPDGLPSFADGRRATELTEAVLASATKQTWVEVPGA